MSLFTLLSMLKIWNGAFWGADPEPRDTRVLHAASAPVPDATDPGAGRLRHKFRPAPSTLDRVPPRLILPGALLVACTVSIGLGAEVLMDLAVTAAEGLNDTTTYTEAVMQ